MGNNFSETRPQLGYHILKVQPNSPGSLANFDGHFDFIVKVGDVILDREDETLVNHLKENINKKIKMTIYSSKTDQIREVEVIPSDNWGGSGLLGVSIRFCSFYGVYENIYHVLHVHKNSPASEAKLQQYNDYIVGTPDVLFNDTEDFSKLLKSNLNKQITIYVYNSQTESIREVNLIPRENWGGDGLIGCDIGVGLLHRIPTSKTQSQKNINQSNQTPNQEYKQRLNELEQKFNDLSTLNKPFNPVQSTNNNQNNINNNNNNFPSSQQQQPNQTFQQQQQLPQNTQQQSSNQTQQPTNNNNSLNPTPLPSNIPTINTQTSNSNNTHNTNNNTTSNNNNNNIVNVNVNQNLPTPLPSNIPSYNPQSNNNPTQTSTTLDDDVPPSDEQLEDVSSLFGDSKSDGLDFLSQPQQTPFLKYLMYSFYPTRHDTTNSNRFSHFQPSQIQNRSLDQLKSMAEKKNMFPPGLVANLQSALASRNRVESDDSTGKIESEEAIPVDSTESDAAKCSKPVVLVTNGDGIDSPGLTFLVKALVDEGMYNVNVCAPALDKSLSGQSVTFGETVSVTSVDINGATAFEVSGTPADCVSLALSGALFSWSKPMLVISGIDKGRSSGHHMVYSGVVAGAREALLCGVPSISISLNMKKDESQENDFQDAVSVCLPLINATIRDVEHGAFPKGCLLNVEVPASPLTNKGFKLAKQSLWRSTPNWLAVSTNRGPNFMSNQQSLGLQLAQLGRDASAAGAARRLGSQKKSLVEVESVGVAGKPDFNRVKKYFKLEFSVKDQEEQDEDLDLDFRAVDNGFIAITPVSVSPHIELDSQTTVSDWISTALNTNQ